MIDIMFFPNEVQISEALVSLIYICSCAGLMYLCIFKHVSSEDYFGHTMVNGIVEPIESKCKWLGLC